MNERKQANQVHLITEGMDALRSAIGFVADTDTLLTMCASRESTSRTQSDDLRDLTGTRHHAGSPWIRREEPDGTAHRVG